MPPIDATGSPQQVRDAPLRGDPALRSQRPPLSDAERVTPSSTRGGWALGGMAIPALLVIVVLVALAALALR